MNPPDNINVAGYDALISLRNENEIFKAVNVVIRNAGFVQAHVPRSRT